MSKPQHREKRLLNETLEIYKRRTVIKSLGYAAVGVALGADSGVSSALLSAGHEFVSKRPAIGQRKFVSVFGWQAGLCPGNRASPATLTSEDNQEYGSGAFLLAGSEMYKLK